MSTNVGSIFVTAGLNDAGFAGGLRRMDSGLKRASRGFTKLAGVATAGLAAGFGVAVHEAVGFDRSMRNVNSIAKLSETQFQAMSNSVRGLAGETGQAPKKLADGMYDIVSSGFKAQDALTILKTSAVAATAGMTDTATSSAAVTAALNAWKLPASEAANVASDLFETVNKGVVTFPELAQNMGDLTSLAPTLGISLQEVTGAFAAMTLQGGPAAEHATRLKGIMAQMVKPSDSLKAAIKSLGFENSGAAIKSLGFAGTLDKLYQSVGGNKEAIAKLFPDIRGLAGFLSLTGKNAGLARDGIAATTAAFISGKAHLAAFAEQSKSVAVQWDKAKATFSAVAIVVGNTLLPALTSILNFTGKVFNAGSVTAAVKIVWQGVKEAGRSLYENIRAFLFTHFETKPMEFGAGTMKFREVKVEGFVDQMRTAIDSALDGTDWSSVGTKITDGIVAGLKQVDKIASRLIALMDEVMGRVDWAGVGVKMGPFLAGMLAAGFVTLMDPSFWAKHWDLALSVALVAFGGSIAKLGAKLLAPFRGLFVDALEGAALGLAGLAERIAPRLGEVVLGALRGAAALVRAGGGIIADAVKGVLSAALALVERVGGKVIAFTVKVLGIEAVIRAIEGLAKDAASKAAAIGSGIGKALSHAFSVAAAELKVIGLKSALSVIEPFSHIPSKGGDWARKMKTSIHHELDQIQAKRTLDRITSEVNKSTPGIAKAGATIGKDLGNKFVNSAGPALDLLTGKVKASVSKASTAVGSQTGAMKSAGAKLGKGVADGTKTGMIPIVGNVTSKAQEAAQAVGGQAGYGFTEGSTLGSAIGEGVASGLESQVGAVQAAASKIVAAAAVAMQAKAQIASPSKLTEEKVGIPLAQGLIKGFTQYFLTNGTEKMADAVKKATSLAAAVGPSIQAAGAVIGMKHALAIARGFTAAAPTIAQQIRQGLADAVRDAQKKALEKASIDAAVRAAAEKIGLSAARSIARGFTAAEPTLVQQIQKALNDAISRAHQLALVDAAVKRAANVLGSAQAREIARGIVGSSQTLSQQVSAALASAIATATQRAHQMALVDAAVNNAARVLGAGQARAIAQGIVGAAPTLSQQVKTALQQAIQSAVSAAAQKVTDARSAFATAFQGLASAALAAFDKAVSQWKSPSQSMLEKMQLEDQINQLQKAIEDAQGGVGAAGQKLAEAIAGGDPEAIKQAQAEMLAAQDTLAAALRSQQEFNLAQAAAAEQAAHEKAMEKRRIAFEQQLNQLQTELAKHPEEHEKIQKKINALLQKYVPGYKAAGFDMGYAIAQGIRDAIKDAESAAEALMAAIRAKLKLGATGTGGGAGPNYGNPSTGDLMSGLPAAAPAGAAGGEVHVHFHGGTFVGADKRQFGEEMAPHIRAALLRTRGRNVSLGLA